MSILSLVVLALIAESVWETLKMVWQDGKVSFDKIGALAVGLVLTLGTGLDLMTLVEIPMQVPIIGKCLTGILIARGANFMHDLLGLISNLKNGTK